MFRRIQELTQAISQATHALQEAIREPFRDTRFDGIESRLALLESTLHTKMAEAEAQVITAERTYANSHAADQRANRKLKKLEELELELEDRAEEGPDPEAFARLQDVHAGVGPAEGMHPLQQALESGRRLTRREQARLNRLQ